MRSVSRLVQVSTICCFLLSPLHAQIVTGSVLGDVTDPTGSGVPGARVVLTNTGTSLKLESTTNDIGLYSFSAVPPGSYRLRIEATGFRQFEASGIQVLTDSRVRVNAALQLGSAAESVQVTAATPAIQTDSTQISRDITASQLANLPNVGRNPLNALITVPGVVPRAGFEGPGLTGGTGDNARATYTNFSVNGARPLSSEVLIDGAPNTSAAFNEVASVPNYDAISELKIITNAYSAEYGRAGGGVINLATKSGSNDFHGSLYEFARNSAFNANTYGNNSRGRRADGSLVSPLGQFNIHDFGGTFSGPLTVPGVYKGKDRSFFFFSYNGVRRVSDASTFFTVPTALERQGDFSQSFVLINQGGQLVRRNRDIYNPLLNAVNITQVAPGSYRIDRPQFSYGGVLNRIDPALINRAAQAFLSAYPLPNYPAQPDGTLNYYDINQQRTRTDQIIGKADQIWNESHRTFFRVTMDWTKDDPPDRYRNGNPLASDVQAPRQFIPTATIGHTWSRSSDQLFEFRFNVTRLNLWVKPPTGYDFDLSSLGFSPAMVAQANVRVWPMVLPLGNISQRQGIGYFGLRDNHTVNYSGVVNYTKTRGRWIHKIGGEYRPYFNNFYQPESPGLGGFRPNNFTTPCSGPGCPSTNPWDGYNLADMIIGSMFGDRAGNQAFSTYDPRLAFKQSYFALYTQNDWRLSEKLTLNLGLRWEYQGPLTERYNRMSQFDRRATNPLGTPGQYVFPGVNGVGRGQLENSWLDFGPRIGFAWRPFNRTVIRAAYGIMYDQTTGVGSGGQGFGIDGFNAPALGSVQPQTGPYVGLPVVAQPFTDFFTGGGRALGANGADPAYLGRSVTAIDREGHTPYLQQWNFTVEREIFKATSLQIGYVGTKGTRLTLQQFRFNGDNTIPQATLDAAKTQWQATGVNPLNALVPNPFFGRIPVASDLGKATIPAIQLLRPYPAYLSDSTLFQSRFGSSSYNSLQVGLQRTITSGVLVTGTYVWSKSIDFGNHFAVTGIGDPGNGNGISSFTSHNLGLDRSVSASDIPHRAVFSWVVDLPFGKGRRYLGSSRLADWVIGGWTVSGITTLASGFPLQISGGGFGRPDVVGDPVLPDKYRVIGDGVTPRPLPDGTSIVVPRNRLLYFNPNAFRNRTLRLPTGNVVDPYFYGTAPRYFSNLRMFGRNDTNMSISKQFEIRERFRIQLRGEAVNVFNHTIFGAPDRSFGGTNLNPATGVLGASTSSTFGTVDINSLNISPRYMQVSMRIVF